MSEVCNRILVVEKGGQFGGTLFNAIHLIHGDAPDLINEPDEAAEFLNGIEGPIYGLVVLSGADDAWKHLHKIAMIKGLPVVFCVDKTELDKVRDLESEKTRIILTRGPIRETIEEILSSH
jgi:hypothetical protein